MKNVITLQGEELRDHLTETLDIDFTHNVIYINSLELFEMYNDINTVQQLTHRDENAFTSWVAYNIFDAPTSWFLFIAVNGYSKRYQYDTNGDLEKSVSLSEGTWFIKDEV